MLKDAVAVIDLGAYSLTAIIGENGVNNNFIVRAYTKKECEVFDGETVDTKALTDAVTSVVKEIISTAKAKLEKICVGIPGEFLRLENREYRLFFNRKRRITSKMITEFYDGAEHGLELYDEEVISRSAVSVFLDGNLKVDDPLNKRSASLTGYVTFMIAERAVLDTIRSAINDLGVRNVEFIPTPLAEGNLLFSQAERNAMEILLDVGYVTSSLTVLMGNGALYHTAYPFGGGYLTAYLYDAMGVDMDIAEKLKRKINLSINKSTTGNYEIVSGDKPFFFPVAKCNDTVRDALDEFAEQLDGDLRNSSVRFPSNITVSLTGGGITYVRGAKEYLASRIEMPIVTVNPNISYTQKPEDTSEFAVLSYALNQKRY